MTPSLEGSTRGQRDLRTLAIPPVLLRRDASENTQTHLTSLIDTPHLGEDIGWWHQFQEHDRPSELCYPSYVWYCSLMANMLLFPDLQTSKGQNEAVKMWHRAVMAPRL